MENSSVGVIIILIGLKNKRSSLPTLRTDIILRVQLFVNNFYSFIEYLKIIIINIFHRIICFIFFVVEQTFVAFAVIVAFVKDP